VLPLLEIAGDLRAFLLALPDEELVNYLRKHERTGRPLGTESFVESLEMLLDCSFKRGKPGPKKAMTKYDVPHNTTQNTSTRIPGP
jgi:putative transposase